MTIGDLTPRGKILYGYMLFAMIFMVLAVLGLIGWCAEYGLLRSGVEPAPTIVKVGLGIWFVASIGVCLFYLMPTAEACIRLGRHELREQGK